MSPRRRHRGSVLLLMPVAVLIVLLLGAIAVDSAILYLRQRQAYDVAFHAANDAAGAGVDLAAVRQDGTIVYDPGRIEVLARQAVDAAGIEGVELVGARADGTGVVVTVSVTVEHLFVQVLGEASSERRTVEARADGVVRRPAP